MAVPGRVYAGAEGSHVDEVTDDIVDVALLDPSELEVTADNVDETFALIAFLEGSDGVVEDDTGRV